MASKGGKPRTAATEAGLARRAATAKKIADTWHSVFVAALASSGVVRVACQTAGVDRSTAYRHRADDPAFADAWDGAMDDAMDTMEAEARRRAIEGTRKPVYYKGVRCGSIREYSDVLLIFMLKGHRPERFRDNFDLRKFLESLPPSQPPHGTPPGR